MENRYTTEILVNGQRLEIGNIDNLNIRLNATLFNPEKVESTSSEYSFTFDVPQTSNNNKIFGLANIPSIKGKFIRNYNTNVLVDGIKVFEGVMRLSSVKEDSYTCNLISIKNKGVGDIFGESTMNEIKWEVSYDGASTINTMNDETDPDYFFPLVCYGAFQKAPQRIIYDSEGNPSLADYTSLMLIDKYNKFYGQSFIPSPKLIELIKRMIEQKGYKYSGNVFSDPVITKIYLSSMLGDEQDPEYNLGGQRGEINIDYNFNTFVNGMSAHHKVYDLKYPTEPLLWVGDEAIDELTDEARDYDIWNNSNSLQEFSYVSQDNYEMWENGNIVIPSSGYYKIEMDTTIKFTDEDKRITMVYPKMNTDGSMRWADINTNRDFRFMPFDVQLVKNTGDNQLEYIATKKIWDLRNKVPSGNNGRVSDFPHEASPFTGMGTSDSYYQPYEFEMAKNPSSKGKTRGYDPWVNPDFVMGCSTASACYAVQKRGKSWNREYVENNKNNYKCDGYTNYHREISPSYVVSESWNKSNYQEWMDTDVPESSFVENNWYNFSGKGYAIVWLNKGDMLSLRLLSRNWRTYNFNYDASVGNLVEQMEKLYPKVNVNGKMKVTAWSPKKNELKKSWFGDSSFSKTLNLGHFLSNKETQKDFFENFITTFNLNYNIDGNEITINVPSNNIDITSKVNVDDRIDIDSGEATPIDFPSKIDVKFSIDDTEAGFYHSVPDDHIDDDDWKSYADIGSEVIKYPSTIFSTNEINKQSKFSRTWYMDFTMTDYWARVWISRGGSGYWNFVKASNPQVLSIPVIAKDENFIDGNDYEEMMKKDGRGLKQRMWFKGDSTSYYLPNRNGVTVIDGEVIMAREYINICLPTNKLNDVDVLKYTLDDNSLLRRYYNIEANEDNNYMTINVYLTPEEYMRLKNGAMVSFDNDVYRLCSITGYDPTGGNQTKLKMLKF